MSNESILVGYLLDSGWKLFVSSDGNHSIYRAGDDGVTVDGCCVSSDTIIDLHLTGRLRRLKHGTVGCLTMGFYDFRPICDSVRE